MLPVRFLVLSRRPLSPASILAVLVVFRNNVSHSRYNEARNAISHVCSGIRTIATVVHNTTPMDFQGEQAASARPEFHHLCSLMLVSGACGSLDRVSYSLL